MSKKAKNQLDDCSGFTLIELMIVLLVTSIIMGVAYSIFSSQQKSYTIQKSVVEIQQSLRAGMYYLTREARLAGYQEEGQDIAGILQARPGRFQFTMDIFDNIGADDWDEIGDNDDTLTSPGENIIYHLSDDSDNDGLPDALTSDGTPVPDTLLRDDVIQGTSAILIDSVEAIGFAYAYDLDSDCHPDFDDTDGDGIQDAGEATIWAVDVDGDGLLETSLDTNGDGAIDINDAAGGASLGTTVDIDRIVMVRIWLLVRSSVVDRVLNNDQTYILGYRRLAVNDNYRRRLLSESIVCRNMKD
jgi:type IV pilus assembly protein PilW